jgi:hypothetical protein
LYFYNARWYDPEVGRFIQADTIIPEPGNPLAWDRYAYGYNNPVNRIDPSGHKVCNITDDSGKCLPDKTNKEILIEKLYVYGWRIFGDFNTKQVSTLYSAAAAIDKYVDKLTGGNGYQWMRDNIGDVNILRDNYLTEKLNAQGFVFPNNIVHLADGFTEQLVAHEVAHVFDNHVASQTQGGFDATFIGGGPSDAMVSALGGRPGFCIPRFISILGKGNYQNYIAGPYSWLGDVYGNNSVADDFADTFEYAIYYPSRAPQYRLLWMNSFISISGSN